MLCYWFHSVHGKPTWNIEIRRVHILSRSERSVPMVTDFPILPRTQKHSIKHPVESNSVVFDWALVLFPPDGSNRWHRMYSKVTVTLNSFRIEFKLMFVPNFKEFPSKHSWDIMLTRTGEAKWLSVECMPPPRPSRPFKLRWIKPTGKPTQEVKSSPPLWKN